MCIRKGGAAGDKVLGHGLSPRGIYSPAPVTALLNVPILQMRKQKFQEMKRLALPSSKLEFKVKPSQRSPSLMFFVSYTSWSGPGLGLVVWGTGSRARGGSERWVVDTTSVLARFLEEATGS